MVRGWSGDGQGMVRGWSGDVVRGSRDAVRGCGQGICGGKTGDAGLRSLQQGQCAVDLESLGDRRRAL
eukprot:1110641-Prymnesium_polylepis.1